MNTSKPQVQEVKRQRPSWDDEHAYDISVNWSFRRWAWEFLRRNPEYQAIKPNARGPGYRDLYARFGRTTLKDFNQHYDTPTPGDESRAWLPERHSGFYVPKFSSERELNLTLKQGEVAVVLDLSRTISAGRAAVESMLSHVRADLMAEMDRYESLLRLKDAPLPKIKKPRRHKLLIRLRILDAIYANASDDEIITCIYPPYNRTRTLPTGDALSRARRMLSEDKKRARALMNGGYLELVPLDYLQDKSGTKEEDDSKSDEE
ncbi:Uncharacterized conserved protein [Janthinobacterium sp. OK676]|uniref:DNA -binding domain-containing protein n=1 Tax=unclassified Janthinobacterium TaxID=2610881 RepID=UPI00089130FF|nr:MULTISPECIES: DUF2285 domain-containing protein [unclassified Janthinobacterium]OEZ88602.1 hypothetical protein JAB6_06420 [Janthinobacterium sp. HH104]SDM79686.1 Uncharacterized conserved protein [Janthinobacterium sp. OK676]